MHKKVTYELVIDMRKRGFSYSEISELVKISKSTVALWCRKCPWSESIKLQNTQRMYRENTKRIRLLNAVRNTSYKKIYARAREDARNQYRHFRSNTEFVSGIVLFLAIGDQKSSHFIRVSSARKIVHREFIHFLTEFLGVSHENISFSLVHSFLLPSSIVTEWETYLHLPVRYLQSRPKDSTNDASPLRLSVGNTIIRDTVSLQKLQEWCNLYQTESEMKRGHG